MRSYGRTKKTISEMIRAILSQIIEQSVQIQLIIIIGNKAKINL